MVIWLCTYWQERGVHKPSENVCTFGCCCCCCFCSHQQWKMRRIFVFESLYFRSSMLFSLRALIVWLRRSYCAVWIENRMITIAKTIAIENVLNHCYLRVKNTASFRRSIWVCVSWVSEWVEKGGKAFHTACDDIDFGIIRSIARHSQV